MTRSPGELVALGTRSSVHAYGRGAVVKVPVRGTADAWIRSEAAFAEAARLAGAPVPRLLGIEQIGNRTASVWERVEGASVWQQVVDEPARAPALGRVLADVQQALFALAPPVTLPRQRDRLATKIRHAAQSIDPGLRRALDLLPEQAVTSSLCHGDLHPSNVILAPGGPVIVDWFDASRGDALADVARSVLVLRSDGEHPPPHLPGADPAILAALTGAYCERLAERHDLACDAFARWQAVNAVARMAEGVPRSVLAEVWAGYAGGGDVVAAAS